MISKGMRDRVIMELLYGSGIRLAELDWSGIERPGPAGPYDPGFWKKVEGTDRACFHVFGTTASKIYRAKSAGGKRTDI
jgi:hypothetical protein